MMSKGLAASKKTEGIVNTCEPLEEKETMQTVLEASSLFIIS